MSSRRSNPFDKASLPFCWKGHDYALKVVAGEIPAATFVVGACERYLNDIADESNDHFYFEPKKAEKFLRLVQKFEHVIGKWKTKNIVFEPWQCWIWMNIMGFMDRVSNQRRFRIAHIEVPRGNAKSAMASQAALYFGFLDDPNGNQVATVATKKEQARIVLDSSREMARKNENFLKTKGVRVLAHSLVQRSTNSVVRALSAEASSLDGLNDVLAVCDELHAMRRETFDVIYSGMSKRTDSLTLCITTAGSDVDSVGHSQSAYAKQICMGTFSDEQMFAVVYTIDEGDDIYDPKTWEKANPNWGVSVDPRTFAAKAEKTKVSPADKPNFLIKHLDVWIQEAKAYYDQKVWDSCYNSKLKIEDFKGKHARLAVDLASHIDITSQCAIFYRPEKKDNGRIIQTEMYSIFTKNFIPEQTIKNEQNDLYEKSVKDGWLIATPGEAINYDYIREEILEWGKLFRVDECYYDTWNATEMAQKLSNKIEMVKFTMSTANLSEPMKKLDALMRQGKIEHDGSPLVRWCLGNVVAKEDHNGNVYPRKSHVRHKIDPIITILMALAGHLQNEEVASVYESRGLRSIS